MKVKNKKYDIWLYPIIILLIVTLPLNCVEITFLKRIELGSEDREEEIFFRIADIEADKNGNIFILDSGNYSLKKFSKEGKFLKEIGREGQGPGEFIRPSNICVDIDGKVYVNEIVGRRISIFDNSLNFLKILKPKLSSSIVDIFIDKEGGIIGLHNPWKADENYFSILSSDGVRLNSFFNERHVFAPKLTTLKNFPGTLVYLSAIADIDKRNSKLAISYRIPENPCRIYILDLNGKILKVIKWKIKNYNSRKILNNFKRWRQIKKDFKYPQIIGIHFTKEDFLIIQIVEGYFKRGYDLKKDSFLYIFSPSGNIIKIMKFNGNILSIDHRNNVYVCVEDEQGISKVIVYSLKIGG